MTKPGQYADGGGLYLTVTKSGSKSWTWRVMVAGKAQVIGDQRVDEIGSNDVLDVLQPHMAYETGDRAPRPSAHAGRV